MRTHDAVLQSPLAGLYAASLKTVALCLLYAPLWPGAYLLSALALALNFVCTKFAVAKWWRKPPMVSEDVRTHAGSRPRARAACAAVGGRLALAAPCDC